MLILNLYRCLKGMMRALHRSVYKKASERAFLEPRGAARRSRDGGIASSTGVTPQRPCGGSFPYTGEPEAVDKVDSLLGGIQFFKGRLRKDTPLSAEADTSPTGGEVELRSIP